MVGTPDADVAWEATDEYTSRMNSPRPSPLPTAERKKRSSSGAEPAVSSPLRKTSFPFNKGLVSDDVVVLDDGSVIHVDPPERRVNKITGGGPADDTMDLGPRGGNTAEEGGWFDDRGDGTPILASDEVLKRPGSAYMLPAVSPHDPQYDDQLYESDETSRRNSLRIPSRPSSRPGSIHGEYQGGNLHRFISHDEHHGSGIHTPLEEIEEYEPLIPEGEEERPKPKAKAALKRPGLEHHHFPSQDIWEDTPNSLQYSTTVETPEPPREAIVPPPAEKTSTFETPEEEQARRNQNPDDMFSDNKTLVNKPHARALDEGRPGVQRFPSQDIWEDTPDSMRLVTTVSGPQMDEAKSPPDDRPSTTGVDENSEDETRATTGFTSNLRPSIPARPQRKSKLAEEIKPEDVPKDQQLQREISLDKPVSPDKAKPPAIPDRPKPSVPARPARTSKGEQAATEELSQSGAAPPIVKAKPAVPARPGGEKIAALKSGFMADLNNRLKLGPQGPTPKAKELEPEAVEEVEKAPLADARKSRAKGPARRKPASSPSAAAAEDKSMSFSFSEPFTLWQIDETDELSVPSLVLSSPEGHEAPVDLPALETQLSVNESHNTAEPPLAEPMSPERAGSPPQATLDEKIIAARDNIDAFTEKEEEVEDPVEDATIADVEAKEIAPATTDAPSAEPAAVATKDVREADPESVA